MKKIYVYAMSTALLAGSMLSSCTYGSYESYLGTMAGGEIGGIIGESIGWMSTSRHSGPGNAMLGGIIGTVAGAVIGNSIGNQAGEANKARRAERKRKKEERQSYENSGSYNNYENNGNYSGGNETYDFSRYQTEGGRATEQLKSAGNYSSSALQMGDLHYEDENGDGKVSKYETINVIYTVTNPSSTDVEVSLVTGDNKNTHFEYSPAYNTTIGAGKTIRYKAKVFCKSVPKGSHSTIPVFVKSSSSGTITDNIQIKNGN